MLRMKLRLEEINELDKFKILKEIQTILSI